MVAEVADTTLLLLEAASPEGEVVRAEEVGFRVAGKESDRTPEAKFFFDTKLSVPIACSCILHTVLLKPKSCLLSQRGPFTIPHTTSYERGRQTLVKHLLGTSLQSFE